MDLRLRLAAVALAILACAGCSSLTDFRDAERAALMRERAPTIVGADGELMGEHRKMVEARLAGYKESGGLLDRHLRIAEAVSGAPLVVGNATAILVDGPAAYGAIFDAIEAARDHIHIQSFIFEELEFDRRLSDVLIAKQRSGVQVRVIYDSVGSISTPASFLKRLAEAGICICEFNPVNPLRARLFSVNHRDHRKIVVVDGRTGFTGGINFHSVYKSGSGPGFMRPKMALDEGWRDTHVKIEGPAVRYLQELFLETWAKQNCEQRAPRNFFPPLKEEGDRIASIIGSSPDGRLSRMYLTLISAITYAQKNVYLTAAYFIPDENTIAALKAAARRGVDVRLLLPGFTDSWLAFHGGRSHYEDLLAAGVRIFEYQDSLLHAKTVVIDGVWSTVGSSNVDWRSFCHNDEVNAVVIGRRFADEMTRIYEQDLRESKEIALGAWLERPASDRLREWLARRLDYLL